MVRETFRKFKWILVTTHMVSVLVEMEAACFITSTYFLFLEILIIPFVIME